MQNRSIDHESATIKSLAQDKDFALAYLNSVLADGDKTECLLAIKRIVEAHGGVSKLSNETKLNEKSLYRALSNKGNPTLKSLLSIFQALNLQFTVQEKR